MRMCPSPEEEMLKMRPDQENENVLLCPRCLSTEVHYVGGLISGHRYRCGSCGYEGALILEVDPEDVPMTPEK